MGKTAVVIIHGVGEQRPMDTVRSFVRFFAGTFFRSKPDRGADLFELRRLSTFASNEPAVKDIDYQLGGSWRLLRLLIAPPPVIFNDRVCQPKRARVFVWNRDPAPFRCVI